MAILQNNSRLLLRAESTRYEISLVEQASSPNRKQLVTLELLCHYYTNEHSLLGKVQHWMRPSVYLLPH